jgi:WD40 repeat protein
MLVASAGEDSKIKLVSRDTGTLRKAWYLNHGAVYAVAFSPGEGSSISAGFKDGIVMVLDVATGQEVCTLMGHTDWVSSVSFSPDGKLLASGSGDKTVMIWDLATGKQAMDARV